MVIACAPCHLLVRGIGWLNRSGENLAVAREQGDAVFAQRHPGRRNRYGHPAGIREAAVFRGDGDGGLAGTASGHDAVRAHRGDGLVAAGPRHVFIGGVGGKNRGGEASLSPLLRLMLSWLSVTPVTETVAGVTVTVQVAVLF